jgi:hypothetical protein
MLLIPPDMILADADANAVAIVVGVFFVIALAAKIGSLVVRAAFGIVQIGIGLIILSVVAAIFAALAATGH